MLILLLRSALFSTTANQSRRMWWTSREVFFPLYSLSSIQPESKSQYMNDFRYSIMFFAEIWALSSLIDVVRLFQT